MATLLGGGPDWREDARAVTAAALRESGFRAPILVRRGSCVEATRQVSCYM